MARPLTVADVRPLIGNLSRANYYEVNFGGLTGGLQGFLSSKGVSTNYVTAEAGLMCYQAQIPGSSLATVEGGNYHGVTENFAHTKIYTPLQLQFYCDDQYRSLKFFEHWMEYVNSGNSIAGNRYSSTTFSPRLKYPNDPASGYKAQAVTIQKFENNYRRILTYSFIGLFPKSLSSTQVQYGPNSELTRISCSFAYDRYIAGPVTSYDVANTFGNNLSNIVNDFANPLTAITRLIN